MPRARNAIRVVPSASRLIGSLRDLGYQTPEAVADLIDNSIVARAKNVDITIRWSGTDSWIRIADDGVGMNGTQITEAMRYGSSRSYGDEDLGKFGLGLKTASMSQCRRLTVASRTGRSGRMEVRQLDLDYIEEYDDWHVLQLGVADRPKRVTEALSGRGTVVLWEGLDRILTYSDPGGGWAERHLKGLAEDLENHLGMVFHRFIQREVRGHALRITINGTDVRAWDPYARDEKHTKTLKKHSYRVSTPYGSGVVELEPFILPPKSSFSSLSAWARMSGPNDWNRQQGLYVYRANRLIQAGTWSYLRAMDEHTKLARIALTFPTSLDAAFGINVAKMRVSLPPELRDQIKDDVSAIAVAARRVYDAKPDQPKHSKRATRQWTGGNGGSASTGVQATSPVLSGSTSKLGPNPDSGTEPTRRRIALQRAAELAGESAALKKIVSALATHDQQIASDLGF